MERKFKSGFVTIIGRPNVGKSTIINSIVGERVSIISSKPQTTRNSIKCIYTDSDFQIVFIDTPGIHKPKSKLGEFMVNTANDSLKGVDVVLAIIDVSTEIGTGDMYIIDMIRNVDKPKILVLNKIDKITKTKLEHIVAELSLHEDSFDSIIPVSAKEGNNMTELVAEIVKNMPEGPRYFPAEMYTDMPEKFVVSELIREKILELMEEEVPHGTAVEIFSMKEREDKDIFDIEATIYCERDSHKGILIGKNGAMLKKIGTMARKDIEDLLHCQVNLKLWVKTKNNWRDSNSLLKSLGYHN